MLEKAGAGEARKTKEVKQRSDARECTTAPRKELNVMYRVRISSQPKRKGAPMSKVQNPNSIPMRQKCPNARLLPPQSPFLSSHHIAMLFNIGKAKKFSYKIVNAMCHILFSIALGYHDNSEGKKQSLFLT